MSSFQWSPLNTSSGAVATYANLAAFPSAASAGNGSLAIALDTNILYESNGTSWIAIAGPGAALSIGSPANGLSLSSNVLSLGLSSTSTIGALSNTDWNTFNNKQAAGNYITALTGDGTAAGPGSVALTLATVNSNVGSFTNASITVNAKGLITAASSGTASVTAVSVATANGFAGSSSGGTTPALTLTTTLNTPVIAGNGTALIAATTTGSGSTVVLATAPTMTNPVVGTQSQGDSSTKAASTSYVDTAVANAVSGVNPAVAVQAATTANLTGYTYLNGASGIGATLTAGSNNVALTVDGYTFTALGQRLLVKDQTSGFQNGVYYVTQIQTAILPVILTRALDYNTPSDINNTGAIPVVNGTVNGTTSWVQTAQITTVGTDSLVFVKFTRNPADYLLAANNLSDVASKSTSFNNLSPMTTQGDIIYGGASGTGTRLAKGTQYQTLQGGATVPGYDAVHLDQATAITGTLPVGNGGTGNTTGTATINANMTGDVTSVGNATTIGANKVTLGMQATLAANSAIANATGSTATPTAVAMTTTSTASAIALRDANKNVSSNNFLSDYTTVVTAAGTTTLTVGSTFQQFFTGSTTQTIVLPVASTLTLGHSFFICNLSSGVVTVNSSGSNLVQTMAASSQLEVTCVLASGTTAASWQTFYSASVTGTIPIAAGGTGQVTKAAAFDALSPMTTGGDIIYGGASGTGTRLANGSSGQALLSGGGTAAPTWGNVATNPMTTGGDIIYGGASGVPTRLANGSSGQYLNSAGGTSAPTWKSFTVPTIQTLTSGSGATYTTPAGVLYLKVKMVGGGGGGSGGGTSSTMGAGGTGGTTTFGTSLLTCVGGGGGQVNGNASSAGGSPTISAPAYGTAKIGGWGSSAGFNNSAQAGPGGGAGAPSPFGGGGGGGLGHYAGGTAGIANTGGGGGGGGAENGVAGYGGAGGSAGGFIEAIIPSPSATYTYTIGAAGTAGTAGTGASGGVGGAGGSGYIEVTEYYT